MGKAEFFLSQEFYTNEFKKNLGFIPFPGTLNVMISEEHLDEINEIK
jgi:riboflavin kinase